MNRTYLIIASLCGLLAVVFGAFGAHALEGRISPGDLENYETGVRYMMYHGLVLLIINTASNHFPAGLSKRIPVISLLFALGILFFSGSLFLISLGLVDPSLIWFITPLGGFLLILGWIGMVFFLIRRGRAD